MERIHIPTLDAMDHFAQTVAEQLTHLTPPSSAYLVALSGELGAGKTTFVQFLMRHLGVKDVVQSPTFVLARTYTSHLLWPERVLHVDAYRLDGPDALRALDWKREVQRADTLILLEWPECVSPLSPAANLHLRFVLNEDGSRSVERIER